MAGAGADRRQDAAVSVLPGRGDPHPHAGSRPRTAPASARPTRRGSPCPAPSRGDERGAADAGRASRRRRAAARFRFRMTQPVPPYLIAIAVGDIALPAARPAHRRLRRAGGARRAPPTSSPTPRRWSTPPRRSTAPIAGAATTCSCCRRRSRSAAWRTRRLTFATPTVARRRSVAGRRSIAHELAHSWSGNLVTNATWNDFWLNEGFTIYFEQRIMEALYGPERMAMLEVLGRQEVDARRSPDSARPRRNAPAARPRGTQPRRRHDHGRLRQGRGASCG